MSTRYRLGKGFTIGSSGIRYGRRIGKVWVSSGKSGTLVAGYGVRHWAPAKRSGVAGQRSVSPGAVRRGTIAVSLLGWAVIAAGIALAVSGAHPGETYGSGTVYPHALSGGFLVVEGFAVWIAACAVRHGRALVQTLVIAPFAVLATAAFLLLLLCV